MKKIYILLLALVAGICLSGCTREDDYAANGNIVIRLQVDGLETKSAGTSDENYVESLQLLIFKDINTAPAKVLNMTDMSLSAGVGPFEKEYATLSAFGGFTATELNDATIYAVANYTGDLSSVANLAAAKAKTVNADAFRTGDGSVANPYAVKTSPRFVMTAETGIGEAFSMEGTKAVANLTLKRRVDKITLGITYDPIVTEGKVNFGGSEMETQTTWTAMTDGNNIRIYLENAAANGLLDGFATDYGFFTYGQTYGTTGTFYSDPFYSYPIDLAAVKGTDNEPFIKLIQPWKYVTTLKDDSSVVVDENIVELYYKIMFPSSVAALLPNTWYKPTVHLKVLGGEASRPTAIVADEILVAGWQSVASGGEIANVEIAKASYLVPEVSNITVNNGNTLQIRYFASAPVTATIVSVTTQAYNTSGPYTVYKTSDAGTIGDSGCWVELTPINDDGIAGTEDDNTGVIKVVHQLSGNLGDSKFSVQPYVYTIDLSMTDNGEDYSARIVVTQNPIVRVDATESTGFVRLNNKTSSSAIALDYYISKTAFPSNLRVKAMGKLDGTLASGGTKYRFTIRTTPDENDHVCDPRVSVSDNSKDPVLYTIINTHGVYNTSTGTWTPEETSGTPIGSSVNAAMLAYKPAAKKTLSPWKADVILKDIAPEFMVASAYCHSGSLYYPSAVLRCAAYQEDGYPAGRWRVPTEAEIQYCVQLQTEGYIPPLFVADDYGYVASSGRRIDKTGTWNTSSATNNTCYVRCVYDTWYWGREEHNACKNGSSYQWGGYQTSR